MIPVNCIKGNGNNRTTLDQKQPPSVRIWQDPYKKLSIILSLHVFWSNSFEVTILFMCFCIFISHSFIKYQTITKTCKYINYMYLQQIIRTYQKILSYKNNRTLALYIKLLSTINLNNQNIWRETIGIHFESK